MEEVLRLDLAGVQHVGDGPSAEVRRGDHILLPARVPRGHRFGRCHGDALGHADELLGRGRLRRWVGAVEHLSEQKYGFKHRYPVLDSLKRYCSSIKSK